MSAREREKALMGYLSGTPLAVSENPSQLLAKLDAIYPCR